MLPLGTPAVIVASASWCPSSTPPLDLGPPSCSSPSPTPSSALPFVMRSVVHHPLSSTIGCARRQPCSVRRLGVPGAKVDRPSWPEAPWSAPAAPCRVLGRVRGHALHRPSRYRHHPRRHLPPAGPAGSANFASAMALAVVLMVLTSAAVLLIERSAQRRAGTVLGDRCYGSEDSGAAYDETVVLRELELEVPAPSCCACSDRAARQVHAAAGGAAAGGPALRPGPGAATGRDLVGGTRA